jgi:hypothetical protein
MNSYDCCARWDATKCSNAADTVLCDQRGTVIDNGTDTQVVSYCASPVR